MFERIRRDVRGQGARGTRGSRVRLVGMLAAVGMVASLAGPAQAGSAHPVGSGRVDPIAQELQTALDEVVAAGVSGVTLRVDTGRRSYRLASGQARLDPPQPMYPAAKIRVGSITKSFVATVALQLVGEGWLSLDDTVERWQPGLIPGGAGITVRQLLNHTSGIFNYAEDQPFVEELLADPVKSRTPQELIAVATAHPPVFAPGAGWSYSNTNYIVLGLILQQVTHRSVSQLIDQRIVRPLQLRHTSLPLRSPDIPGYHAHGYWPPSFTGDGYRDFARFSPTLLWAAGALVSNVDDVRRFYRALLGGRLLRPAQLAEMKTLVEVEPGFGYGLGLYRQETLCGPIWGHDGLSPGYVTVGWNDESGQRGVSIGLATEPDPQSGPAVTRLVEVALCRALGQEPPPATTAADAAPSPHTWARLVDLGQPVAARARGTSSP